MRFSLLPLATVPAALAAPLNFAARDAQSTDIIPGKFLISLAPGASDTLLARTLTSLTGAGATVAHSYSIGTYKGAAISASDAVLATLQNLPNIARIEPDSRVSINAEVIQQNPPYGLARISHRAKNQTTYNYDSSAGEGTYSYIIDTGIRVTHEQFAGRAVFGANLAGDGLDTDGNGHGTHVAGTTGGTDYGVAKKTNLIAVKVLDASGSGSTSNVIAGIQWAVNDMKAKGAVGKSVANLSLGGVFSPTTNDAAAAAVAEGLFLAVAAGNSGLPTITSSPASAPEVFTVAASDANDQRASFSNFGELVDIFAPGVNVLSSWKDSDTSTNTISGTSMATPHVAGLAAYILGLEGPRTPDALGARLQELSTKGAILLPLSKNYLAFNGISA